MTARHVARYTGDRWLPLSNDAQGLGWSGGGRLATIEQHATSVNALAWDSDMRVLFIGGKFDTLNSQAISPGLA